jgi:hypothetical protein
MAFYTQLDSISALQVVAEVVDVRHTSEPHIRHTSFAAPVAVAEGRPRVGVRQSDLGLGIGLVVAFAHGFASLNLRGRAWPVVSLALEKRLFLNVPRKRLLVSPFGKKPCDINERHNPF